MGVISDSILEYEGTGRDWKCKILIKDWYVGCFLQNCLNLIQNLVLLPKNVMRHLRLKQELRMFLKYNVMYSRYWNAFEN